MNQFSDHEATEDFDPPAGRAHSSEELLVAVLGLAGLTKDLQRHQFAATDETQRAIGELREATNKIVSAMDRTATSFAPDACIRAAQALERAGASFTDQVDRASVRIELEAKKVTKQVLLSAAGVIPIGFAMLLILLVVLWKVVPPIDEVRARRAVMAVEPVRHKGGIWVQIDQTKQLCSPQDPEDCGTFGRVR